MYVAEIILKANTPFPRLWLSWSAFFFVFVLADQKLNIIGFQEKKKQCNGITFRLHKTEETVIGIFFPVFYHFTDQMIN